jgi:branched-chain amino acid aminotransferase
MAKQMGFKVEERVFDVAEMMEWVKTGEAALSGTAAVLAGVGTLVRSDGTEVKVGGTGDVGPVTQKLRAALVAIQNGTAPDTFGWNRKV